MLKSKGFELLHGTHVKKVEEKCAKLGVCSKTQEEDIIAEGWMGKPNVMMQVLWERGHIDKTNLKNYMVNGKKDAYGVVDLSTSLENTVPSCTDFAKEESPIQSMGRKMGTIDSTPKFHSEISGAELGIPKESLPPSAINHEEKPNRIFRLRSECCSRT